LKEVIIAQNEGVSSYSFGFGQYEVNLDLNLKLIHDLLCSVEEARRIYIERSTG